MRNQGDLRGSVASGRQRLGRCFRLGASERGG